MRKVLLVLWLLLPVAALGYHFGPGQRHLQTDSVAALLAQAERLAANKQWAEAESKYEAALGLLPAKQVQANRRIRLELAKVQMYVKKLPAAHRDLKILVEELQNDQKSDAQLLADAREALANSQYYITWLMRLEGHGKDRWGPEIEAARQSYRLLAEKAEKTGDAKSAKKHREDLEATIRLARMDLSDLQGLPLPSQ